MEDQLLLKTFSDNGLIVSAEGYKSILKHQLDPEEIIKIAQDEGLWFLSDDFIEGLVTSEAELDEVSEDLGFESQQEANIEVTRTNHILAKEMDSQLKIHSNSDVSSQSTCDSTITAAFPPSSRVIPFLPAIDFKYQPI